MTSDTATDDRDATAATGDDLWLGPDVVRRMRLPGPPQRDTPRPPAIGSVASSSSRFASSLARPVPTRQSLRGPEVAAVQSFRNADASPPRWWHPELVPPAPAPAELPRRGLPRAVHRVPNEASRTPGGILGSLAATTVPVRRMEAVVAAGPMLTQHDKARLTAAGIGRSDPAAPPAAPTARPTRRPAGRAPSAPSAPEPTAPPASTPPPATSPTAATEPTAPTASTPDGGEPSGPSPSTANGAEVAEPMASTAPEPRPVRWRPERVSRLQATQTARTTEPELGVPRGVAALAGVGAGALSAGSGLGGVQLQPAPLPRMLGGGHSVVSPATGTARATVTTPGSMVGAAAWRRASVPDVGPVARTAGRHRAATADAPAAAAAAAAAVAPSAAAAAAGPTPGDQAGAAPATADDAGTAGVDAVSAASDVTAAPGRRRRSAAASGPAGIALASTRGLAGATQSADTVTPALTTNLATSPSAGHAWLPGARQRAAATTGFGRPGDGLVPGFAGSGPRARGFGMSDLLSSTSPLARDGDAARNGLATAFTSPDDIRPAGSSPARGGAPTVGAPVADDPAEAGVSSPLAAARRRAATRAAAAPDVSPAAGTDLPAGSPEAQARRRTGTSGLLGAGAASTALAQLPAPPPMSLRSSEGGERASFGGAASAPPVPRSAAGGGLRRSLIDVTAGMFDSLGPDSDSPSAGPPVPSPIAEPEGADAMSAVQRRLAAVTDPNYDSPVPATATVLNDPEQFNALVDQVVERLESRVIDELERRGRRYNPGVF